MSLDLPLLWAGLLAFGILMYVLTDGFDLGIGLLFVCEPAAEDRDVMMNTVAPVWDGNETWLVLGGAALYGAFPLAYAVLLDAFAIPLLLMLLGLIFRGVAFEFRFKADVHHRHWWDRAFVGGSFLATLSQGVMVGAFLHGLPVSGRAYAGGALDWLSPFALFCGLALTAAYALLGATWLLWRTEGALQQRMRARVPHLLLCLMAAFAIISLVTPLLFPAVMQRWFSLPNLFYFLPVPLLVAVLAVGMLRSVRRGRAQVMPFLMTFGLLFLAFSGLVISVWPMMLPPAVTLWQAAAPTESLRFMLWGALIVLPLVLLYSAWSYYVFRGKVTADSHYH